MQYIVPISPTVAIYGMALPLILHSVTACRIHNAIRSSNYDMTYHAVEEMAEDNLGILDIESAILSGQITKIERDDLRGTKYIIKGIGIDQFTLVGVVGRFKETGIFLIITVYKIT